MRTLWLRLDSKQIDPLRVVHLTSEVMGCKKEERHDKTSVSETSQEELDDSCSRVIKNKEGLLLCTTRSIFLGMF